MTLDPLTAAFDLGKVALEKLFPDPTKRAEEMRKLEELRQNGNLAELTAHVQLMTGQININIEEAKHKSVFVAGWRPFMGWVGGGAMAWQFIVYPMLLWVWSIAEAYGKIPAGVSPPPVLDTGALFSVITGMLGIAGMRSYDKGKGTHTDKLGT